MTPFKKHLRQMFLLLLFAVSFSLLRAEDSISVYVFLSETCPVCQNQTLTLRQLYSDYSAQGISFTGIFPNAEFSNEESIRRFGKKYKLTFELKEDKEHALTDKFSATTTPQVFVIHNSTGRVLYQGKVDNGFEAIGRQRQVITQHYLKDALDSILHGTPILVKQTTPVGCYIIKS